MLACDVSAYSDSHVISGINTASQALLVALLLHKSACAAGGDAATGQGAIHVDTFCMADIEFMMMPDGSLTSRS